MGVGLFWDRCVNYFGDMLYDRSIDLCQPQAFTLIYDRAFTAFDFK